MTSAPPPAPDDVPPFRYRADLATEIELAWQDRWEREGTFAAANVVGELAGEASREPKYFVMDMFPYPSGKGLHVGHPLGYIATDVVARRHRMAGRNVLYTLGYDAFGLPAEQYAVQTGQHPRVTTEANIETQRRQLRRLGLSHDRRRSIATTDADYVRWTQWIFLSIYNAYYDETAPRPDGGVGAARPIGELIAAYESGERAVPGGRVWMDLSPAEQRDLIDSQRLAYLSQAPVNWCPGLGTVLANEEVTAEGRSERGNFPVFQRQLRQWMMRITAYADRLAADLDTIDWPDKIVAMQRNWIGRSQGASVDFEAGTEAGPYRLTVYTTRPDTLFGATFMVVSPEHPILAEHRLSESWDPEVPNSWRGTGASPREAVANYQHQARAKTPAERVADAGRKTGVFTGIHAINPVNGESIPVFTADYVLMGYGTGAIMAVPGGDERDFEFATAFGLPVIHTVRPPEGFEGGAYAGDGEIINSANAEISLDGCGVPEAKAAITAWLEAKGLGHEAVTYRLRDWLFSRQRYWGEPFPIVYDELDNPIALPDSMLPVDLPEVPDFSPRTFDPMDADSSPEPPLARNEDWVNVELDLGDGPRLYRRDTNTMPNWAGSCWYYLRYVDPTDTTHIADPANERYWMAPGPQGGTGGVDLYVGGVEHAVLHLLYARFWHKVLYDLGYVTSPEPFHRLFNQGYIQAPAYTDARGAYVPADEVIEVAPGRFEYQGEPVTREFGKMGKSLKNMVSPDEMYEAYGADTLRVHEMSMGPLDVSKPWDTRTVIGSQRFLQRLWRNVVDETTGETTVVDVELDEATVKLVHRTIAEVTEELDNLRLNTAIAKLIVLNNHLTALQAVPRAAVEPLILMLAPIAPHVCEELWHRLGHPESLAREAWPVADPRFLAEDTVTCVVQVTGKVRDRIEVSPSISDAELEAAALASPAVVRILAGAAPRRVIVRAPGLVNIVP